MKEIETGLTVKGNADFGKALVEAAVQANKDALQKRVVSTIGDLLKQVERNKLNLEQAQQQVDRLNGMVKALKTGQFTLNQNGQITYNNAEYNGQMNWISACAQCGYDKIVIAEHRGAR